MVIGMQEHSATVTAGYVLYPYTGKSIRPILHSRLAPNGMSK